MKLIKDEIINFLHHPFEQRGHIIFWIVLSVAIFSAPYIFRYFLPPEEIELSNFDDEIAKLREKVVESDEEQASKFSYTENDFQESKKKNVVKKTATKLSPFHFDPNTVSKSDLERMKLSTKRANTIINYRNKGGRFFQKEDLKKIYGLSEEEYRQLEAFIFIEKSDKTKALPQKKPVPLPEKPKQKEKVVRIDVNKATMEEWQELSGIGPYYAKKITNFRDKLGGFSSIEQIGDTYGLKDSTFQVVKRFLDLSPVYRKININTMPADSIKNHPYIKWNQANVIVKYRNQHGALTSIEDLEKVGVFSENDLEKIQPYIEFFK